MADGLLLASARVVPEKLIAAGFRFGFEDIENALRATL
jgi:NAD dependent epimerase/dehydratase family enzyme